ncbi:MAG: FtsQ-type POTRA domain-containing protein [Candidatus Eisenbacteria bacterium]|nr:FtsQ-type POTRA domain-containing protein [Candidatus Eisenbacteria bacterium]
MAPRRTARGISPATPGRTAWAAAILRKGSRAVVDPRSVRQRVQTWLWPPSFRARRQRKRWLRRTAAGLALGAVVLALLGVWHPLAPLLRIRAVRLEARGPLASDLEALRRALPVRPGDSFLALRTAPIAAALEAQPRIAEVTLDYRWFQELVVTVRERRAVAALIGAEGMLCEVAADGVLLPIQGRDPGDLPLISWEGQTPARPLAPGGRLELRGAPHVCDLLERIRARRPALWRGLSEARLLADGTCEFYWSDAPIVAWSRGPVSDLRLDGWAAVMDDLVRRGERDAVVDLRYRDQIVVRLPEEDLGPAENVG